MPNVSKEEEKAFKKKDTFGENINRFPITPVLLEAEQRNRLLAQVYLTKDKALSNAHSQNFNLKQVKALHNL